jgi:DNA-binding GntR family transcriptional regulator
MLRISKKSIANRSTPGKPAGKAMPVADDILAISSPRERVTADIIKGLYEGRYKPGQRLVEGQLTETYGVSRGPVREALYRLDQMGLVTLLPQRGGQVRNLDLDDAIAIMRVVQGMMQISARLAAERIHLPGHKEILLAELERLETFDHTQPGADYPIARDRFYATITQLADNAELERIMPSVQIHLVRIQFRDLTRPLDSRRHAGYRKLVEAILSGQPSRAEEAVRRQFSRTITFLSKVRDEAEPD